MKTDFLVIGSGVAGLSFAIKVAELGDVILVTKKEAAESNTNLAQGGIASVIDTQDSFESHVADTIAAGAGLCDPERVAVMVREGPARVRELLEWGVAFSQQSGQLDLGREGGHSRRRIVHVADFTGRELERVLLARAREHPRIRVLEHCVAVNLARGRHLARGNGRDGRVHGAYILETRSNEVRAIAAHWTVLATGGCGKVYAYTSNPDVATGDGVAMAYRAGARIANMEFVQFHPTCLYHPELRTQLISEAVRGEGALLRNGAGETFMERYDARRELAPRDIVARAIDQEMKIRGEKHVWLDFAPIGRERIPERFPGIFAALQTVGIDPREEWVPVVPAAHYCCGGVAVDIEGRTNLEGLLALGEVSCTGVHGANRLASNSLLEAVTFAHLAAGARLAAGRAPKPPPDLEPWSSLKTRDYHETVVLDHDWDLVRRIMMDYVGIVRSDERLGLAQARIRHVRRTVERFYWRYKICGELVELRNIALVAELIIRSARRRQESRGLHYTIDHPETDPAQAHPTLLQRGASSA
ncbi:MAG: L-aspartate oxidase [Candidatus Krumholzibacteriota bacterium]|nr:L-aspartate oxidase [Candidatus Krumholzibacteriota bacterium]